MSYSIRSFLVAALAVAASSAIAQSDPRITSSVTAELSPNEVTLSRAGFEGLASFRVKVTNGTTNNLNRSAFTAETSVIGATATASIKSIPSQVVIPVLGGDPGCSITLSNRLVCGFGDGNLSPNESYEFIMVVKSPTAGSALRVKWKFGGDEGNGNGNGCCTHEETVTPDTLLIDAAAENSTVKTHVQSFAVKGTLSKVFTGLTGEASPDDPWVTSASLGNEYLVNALSSTFTQATLDEKLSDQSCSPINKNYCWLSLVAIPYTTWPSTSSTLDGYLWITLDRHSLIIKNGTKLSDYKRSIQYSSSPGVIAYASVPLCVERPDLPVLGQPCVDACQEWPFNTSPPTFRWECKIKAKSNGGYRIE